MPKLPLWARKFLTDFVETGIALVFALNLAVPTNTDEAKVVAFAVGGAVLSAAISAARRSAPDFVAWLAGKLGTTPQAPGS